MSKLVDLVMIVAIGLVLAAHAVAVVPAVVVGIG